MLSTPAAADALSTLASGWARYQNARFGTIVEIPPGLKPVEPPPENGDGRMFEGGGLKLTVYGSYGPQSVTDDFTSYKKWLLDQFAEDGARVSYKAEGKDWLVYSWQSDSAISYSKVVHGCGAAHQFVLEYPAADRSRLDGVAARVSKSLRCRTP